MDFENYFQTIASIKKKDVLILSDRGCMDHMVYAGKNARKIIYKETGWTKDQIRDSRYDLVIHLVTSAKGALEYYKKANEEKFKESVEEALFLDQTTEFLWMGHPNHE